MADSSRLSLDSKRRLWLSSGAGVALVVAIVVVANLLVHFVYVRLDLSRGNIYSVSTASKRLIRSLPDPVLVTLYYSKELPPQIATTRNYLRDLLKEYASGSAGKIKVGYVEVSDDQKVREQAMQDGVTPVRFDIFSKEKFEQQEGFLGLVLRYEDKKDVIPFVQNTSGMEYDLTARIKMLSSAVRPVIAFATGGQEMTTGNLDPQVVEALRQRYELRDIDLTKVSISSAIASDIGTLFVLGPQAKFTDKELFLLDQYLLSGRALCVALNTKRVNMQNFMALGMDTGLEAFLKHHGIAVVPTLVMDVQSQPIAVSVQQAGYIIRNVVQYPLMVLAKDINADHPVTKALDGFVLPFVSPVEVANKPEMTVDVLARSSRRSWAKKPELANYLMLNPFQIQPPNESDLKGPFTLAAVETGKFDPFMTQPPQDEKIKTYLTQAAKPGRLVVIGTSKFLEKDIGMPEADDSFFLNLVDWMSQDADLIAIRSKSVSFHPLREVPDPVKMLIRYVNMLLPTCLAVCVGLWRWRKRMGERALHAAQFAKMEREPVSV